MSNELVSSIEFSKTVDIKMIVDFLFNLGYPLSKLNEKEKCFKYEFKSIKELKKLGYNQFISKQLTPDITFIVAILRNPPTAVAAVC